MCKIVFCFHVCMCIYNRWVYGAHRGQQSASDDKTRVTDAYKLSCELSLSPLQEQEVFSPLSHLVSPEKSPFKKMFVCDRVLFCVLGWPGTCDDPLASMSQVLGGQE